jgi:hypothetical protein
LIEAGWYGPGFLIIIRAWPGWFWVFTPLSGIKRRQLRYISPNLKGKFEIETARMNKSSVF